MGGQTCPPLTNAESGRGNGQGNERFLAERFGSEEEGRWDGYALLAGRSGLAFNHRLGFGSRRGWPLKECGRFPEQDREPRTVTALP